MPGVGPVVALTFRATLDDDRRASSDGGPGQCLRRASCRARTVRRNAGIAGTSPRPGRASCGVCMIQAAWACWKSTGSGTLRAWAEQLAARRGPAHRGGRAGASPESDSVCDLARWVARLSRRCVARRKRRGRRVAKPRVGGGERGPFLDHRDDRHGDGATRRCERHDAR